MAEGRRLLESFADRLPADGGTETDERVQRLTAREREVLVPETRLVRPA
ncbi:hypothetical protein [Streptomyces sp. NPDC005907]